MKKVLIVDDAQTVLKIVDFALRQEGYEVSKAINATEALQQVEERAFDIGIFDVNMPGKNGIQLTREVLERPNGSNMKIVMLTTESSPDIQERGRAAGCIGWLVKPFQNDDLVRLLGQL